MTQQSPEQKIGDKMPNGTVYAGISPETNKPMYTTPADAFLTMTFNEARKYAAKLIAHGHRDWRVPTLAELTVLFNNRAAIGGFKSTYDKASRHSDDWYWSTEQVSWWGKQGELGQYKFSYGSKLDPSLLRCVR